MTARLASGVLAGALMRRVQAAGGSAAVLAKGDAQAGAVLVRCAERGAAVAILERVLGVNGYGWRRVAEADLDDYAARRRARDPDLWLIELDIPDSERFVVETIGVG